MQEIFRKQLLFILREIKGNSPAKTWEQTRMLSVRDKEIGSLHTVNIKIHSAENWVSGSEIDTRDIDGGLRNNQTLKRRWELADIENRAWGCNLQAKRLSKGEEPTKASFPELNTKAKCRQPIDWRLEVLLVCCERFKGKSIPQSKSRKPDHLQAGENESSVRFSPVKTV